MGEGRSEPEWLTGRELDAWMSFAGVLFQLPAALDAQLQREARLNHFEYFVLAMLSGAPERTLRMSELAARASASQSRLSHLANRLEDRGWIRRAPCPHDGRATNATLTEAGLEKLTASAPAHVAEVRRLVIDALTDAQVEELRGISRRILSRLGSGRATPGTG
jgi:DNA-binding MarR family transcriptional regulator